MAHLLHILFVVFYRRTLLSILVIALAWDFYYVGPKDSVFLYGVLTLSERALEGSKHFPEFMDQAYDAFRSFYESINDAGAILFQQFQDARPLKVGAVDADLAWALTMAGYRTGISPDYLTKVATLESQLDTHAEDSRNDKAGLYLLDTHTWISLMDEHGGSYGKGGHAHEIVCSEFGPCAVSNKSEKQAILALRHDGVTSTFLAAELTRKNRQTLSDRLSRDVSAQELYLAHKFGAHEAAVFIAAADNQPFAFAADLLPDAAIENIDLFYGPLGSQRTVASVRAILTEQWNAPGADHMPPKDKTESIPIS